MLVKLFWPRAVKLEWLETLKEGKSSGIETPTGTVGEKDELLELDPVEEEGFKKANLHEARVGRLRSNKNRMIFRCIGFPT